MVAFYLGDWLVDNLITCALFGGVVDWLHFLLFPWSDAPFSL